MENLMDDLVKALKGDTRVFADGVLLKNKLTELALKLDQGLVSHLLSDPKLKEAFFFGAKTHKENILIFDKDKFISYVNNKEFLPDSFTAFKNRIGLVSNREYIKEKNEVVLAWPYKDCVLEGGQDKEDQKLDEIFYNEVLAPDEIDRLLEEKALSNFKRIDARGVNALDYFGDDDNLIILGNNLLALRSIGRRFREKIKVIYIDPPYGKKAHTFYNDDFKNSTWLTFMKNRLLAAKELLRSDGFLFVQIDDEQFAYLKVLCDELFGRENAISVITVKSKTPSGVGQESIIFDVTERILVYAKDIRSVEKISLRIFDEIVDEKSKTVKNYRLTIENWGEEKSQFSLKTGRGKPIEVVTLKGFSLKSYPVKELSRQFVYKNFDKLYRLETASGGLMKQLSEKLPKEPCYIEYVPEKGRHAGQKIRVYFINRDILVPLSEVSVKDDKEEVVTKMVNVHNNWTDDHLWQGIAKEGGVQLKNGKKPEALIKRILDLTIRDKRKDIVLDFFLGSGTTCAVAHKMQVRYVGIEQLDYMDNDSVTRLKNVIRGDKTGVSQLVNWKGGGSFVYAELKEANQDYASAILKAKTTKTLLDIYKKMKKEAFFRYEIDPKKFDEGDFAGLVLKEQKRVLFECLDKNHLYVNFSEIDDITYQVSAEDKKRNREFYVT